jgi:hypothetical protein
VMEGFDVSQFLEMGTGPVAFEVRRSGRPRSARGHNSSTLPVDRKRKRSERHSTHRTLTTSCPRSSCRRRTFDCNTYL